MVNYSIIAARIVVFYPACFRQDYFADAKRKVQRDVQQNYRLEYGRENNTHTVLAFSRDLLTCDTNDKDITVRGWWKCFIYGKGGGCLDVSMSVCVGGKVGGRFS